MEKRTKITQQQTKQNQPQPRPRLHHQVVLLAVFPLCWSETSETMTADCGPEFTKEEHGSERFALVAGSGASAESKAQSYVSAPRRVQPKSFPED